MESGIISGGASGPSRKLTFVIRSIIKLISGSLIQRCPIAGGDHNEEKTPGDDGRTLECRDAD